MTDVTVQAEEVISRMAAEIAALTQRAIIAEAARDQLAQDLAESNQGAHDDT